jgi:oligogalacturonide lyase
MAAMDLWPPGAERISRRRLLLAAGGVGALLTVPTQAIYAASGKGETLPADWGRYADPSTEFEILRLTQSAYASHLSAPPGRAVARHTEFVILATDRTGTLQLQRLDLKSGQCRVLTSASHLHPSAFALSADDRTAYYLDGVGLYSVSLGNLRVSQLWESASPLEQTSSLAPSDDGTALWFAVNSSDCTLMKLRLGASKPEAEQVLRHEAAILEPVPNPRRALVAWRCADGSAWLCEQDGGNKRRVDVPAGRVLQGLWSADGRSILYLHDPGVQGESVSIREQEVDSRADRLVSNTSQFACFARNANATVFAGASRSKASPYALLLLRITRRELTLCEHRSRDASSSAIAFSPDSQRLLFQGDREGKPVVYSIKLERLVEKTES